MVREFTGEPRYQSAARLAIVVSRYNETITGRLLQGSLDRLAASGVPDDGVDVFRVPGAWEIPLVVQQVAESGAYAAVIALGCVIRGETTHDQHINRYVSLALGELTQRLQIPIPLGLLTCQSMEQALQRAGGTHGNKGAECAEVALELIDLLARLPNRQ